MLKYAKKFCNRCPPVTHHSFAGAIGNIITMMMLLMEKKFRRPLYVFLVGIAFSDFLCCAIFIPYEALQSYWIMHFRELLGDDNSCAIEVSSVEKYS